MGSLIEARRRILMASAPPPIKIDTRPVIIADESRYDRYGNVITQVNNCCTQKYAINPGDRLLCYYGIVPSTISYVNDSFNDYWNITATSAEKQGRIVSAAANYVAFTLQSDMLDVCYVYEVMNGHILFAGRESRYYGYTNINDMPQGI